MTFNENDHPRGTAGRFTESHHSEAGSVTLGAPAAGRPELAGYTIPAPLERQAFLDGTPVTAGTFEEAYEEFFRPLDDYEAEHGPWETTRPPSESTLLKLAGVDKAGFGRIRGVFLEADEATGEPLIEVHTRNPGYCFRDDCDGTCHGCLEDGIRDLSGFVRTDKDTDGSSHFFRPADRAAAQRHLTEKDTRDKLNHRLYARKAIASGKQPPWAILSQVRDGEQRRELTDRLAYGQKRAGVWRSALQYADQVTAAVDAGGPLPKKPVSENYPEGGVLYDMHREAVENMSAEATAAKAQAAELQTELRQGLPPAAAALVTAEKTRLETAAADAEKKVAKARGSLVNDIAAIRRWAARRHENAALIVAEREKLETAIRNFDWSSSWPGDSADCPPAPAAD
jgi:hypothetical protein